MVHTQDEIMNALQVIKDECDEIYRNLITHNCIDCPFSGAVGECVLEKKIPTEWNIKPRDTAWKAFGDY